MKKLIMLLAALAAVAAEAAITITGVTARQRWPWNSLVDVDFTISGAAVGEAFAIDLNAEYAGGDKKLAAYTYVTEPVVAGSATHRITWNMGADYPNFRAEDLRISVTATPFSSETPVYMVIDLSGGKDATSYPVRYTTTPPAHVQGAIDEPCQTTELWMRRIPAANQTFVIAGRSDTPSESNNFWWSKLTKDFYIAIFETTQRQWNLIAGTWPSKYSNETFRASRPLDKFYSGLIFDSDTAWSDKHKELAATCIMQKMRDRTGLSTLNLPSEGQWQFAACAGDITTPTSTTSKELYSDPSGTAYASAAVARTNANKTEEDSDLCSTNAATACVGSYAPNAFGLYDMLGNVWEDVLGRYVSQAKLKEYYANPENGYESPITDSQGILATDATALYGTQRSTIRGGAHLYSTAYSTLWYRSNGYLGYSDDNGKAARGFRFCVTCE